MQTQLFLWDKGLTVRFQDRSKYQPAHYWGICEKEVFNYLFFKVYYKRKIKIIILRMSFLSVFFVCFIYWILCNQNLIKSLNSFQENEKKYVVHCIRCSIEMDKNLKNFICLEEYSEEDLMKTYDDFILYSEDQVSTPQSGLGYCEETAKTPALS